jgi:DNA-binding ferritin-like protein
MGTIEAAKHNFKDLTPERQSLVKRLRYAVADADFRGDHVLAELLTETIKEIENGPGESSECG